MISVLVEPWNVFDIVEFTVDTHPDKPVLSQRLEKLREFAFPPGYDRRIDGDPASLRQRSYGLRHLLYGCGLDQPSAVGAGRRAYPGKEHPQIIIDLGNCPYRRSGVVRGGLLFYGNGGRQALDRLDLWFCHLFEKLPCIGAERLHIPALTLCIEGVKGER